MGGFEDWVRVVGSILAFHGIGGLLTKQRELTDQLTDDGSEWDGFIKMMAKMTTEAREAIKKKAEAIAAGKKRPETRAAFEPGVSGDPTPAEMPIHPAGTATGTTTDADDAAAVDAAAAVAIKTEWSALELIGAMALHDDVVPPVYLGRHDIAPRAQARMLGKALREHRDGRFGDYVLRGRIHGSALWSLDEV